VLEREIHGDIAVHIDRELLDAAGILVAFTERTGGVSSPPFESLNLASHVGDRADCVDRNRSMLFDALGIASLRDALVTAEQVHEERVVEVRWPDAGRGAWASGGLVPIPAADALWTRAIDVPLMLLFADCVPVVLVHRATRTVAVVHAGWRGALSGIVGKTASMLADVCGTADDLYAYVGAHIGACCYEVAPDMVARFTERFSAGSAASGHLDLEAVVSRDLTQAGVTEERQATVGPCTAHATERFYSYRSEGRTGRHAALALVKGQRIAGATPLRRQVISSTRT